MNPDSNDGPLPPHNRLKGIKPVTQPPEETEPQLLSALQDPNEDPIYILQRLAFYYNRHGRTRDALECLRRVMDLTPNLQIKARLAFSMGETAAASKDYAAAAACFREVVNLQPALTPRWFYSHSNLAFCLNQLGRFNEAAKYARIAISIWPEFPHGHQNLGIALEGQRLFHQAATSFADAIHASPGDREPINLLLKLIEAHPELEDEFGRGLF